MQDPGVQELWDLVVSELRAPFLVDYTILLGSILGSPYFGTLPFGLTRNSSAMSNIGKCTH